jgi:rare lipoprotein A
MRGTMKVIATATALVLSVGMAAASDPGTTKASSSAAQNSIKKTEKPEKAAATTAEAPKVAPLGRPTRKKPQIGTASWYGQKFQGKPTASGEPYDMYEFTAAHRELPMGSWLKVTNLRTGKWLIVRINDRGPFVGDRILDLSDSAAQMLDIKARGVARVKLEIVDEPAIVANATSFSME